MNGLQFLASVRRQGIKPGYVMLDVVPRKALPAWVSGNSAHVEIGAEERLSDMDFRPLVGLSVQLGGAGCSDVRLRRAAKLAAEAKPALLCVFTGSGEDFTMHRLWADGRTDKVTM
jgi:hypothetical protein